MTSYRLMDGVGGRPGGGSGTALPSSSVTYTNPITVSTGFEVTQGTMYLQGYWYYLADSGQPTTPQSFCLWQVVSTDIAASGGLFVAGSQVTSGTLSLGWNYVPYATPLALTPNTPYRAQTGMTGNFLNTASQYGTGNPYSAGITNGPLFAYSDASGSAPFPPWTAGGGAQPQSAYSTASADPTATYAAVGNSSFLSWLDVQVTDVAPAGGSYRIWPNYPAGGPLRTDDSNGYTIATEFTLSESCYLDNLWWYSPAGAADLPTRCLIWDVNTQLAVPGTDNASPSWSGAAGAGWIKVAYNQSVTLPAGDYKASVFHAALSNHWFSDVALYWTPSGGGGYPGANGITNGPLAALSHAASTTGQSSYHLTTFGYPATQDGGANDWTDVEVTPVATAPNVPPYTASMSSM